MLKTTFDVTAELGGETKTWRVVKRDALSGNDFHVSIFSDDEKVHELSVPNGDDIYAVKAENVSLDGHALTFAFGYATAMKDGLVVTQGDTELYRSFEGDFSDGGAFGTVLRKLDTDDKAEEDADPLEDEERGFRNYVVSVVLGLLAFALLFYLGKDTTIVVAFLAKKALLPIAVIAIVIVGVLSILVYELARQAFKRSDKP